MRRSRLAVDEVFSSGVLGEFAVVRFRVFRRAVMPRTARRTGVPLLIAALLAPVVGVPPATAEPVTAAQQQAVPPEEAPDEQSAARAAREHRKSVRVASRITETSEVVANPDGTFTFTQHFRPVRVRRDNTWVPVDTTLRRLPDGTVAPIAVNVDLRLSGGGEDRPLVVLGKDGREVGLRWPGPLPEPVLDGPIATYPEVLPGVDLVVRADVQGFNQVLVVKSREAALQPALRKVTFGSHTKGVRVVRAEGAAKAAAAGQGSPAGGLQAVDDAGKPVFVGDASRMWDSSGQASPAERATGPGEGGRRATMGVEVGAGTVAVLPDRRFLEDPATTYPVFIDPEYVWHGGKNHHVVVQDQWPDEQNYDKATGALSDLKAGYVYEGRWITSRSFVEMDMAPMRGKIIHSAVLHTRVINSYSCSGGPTEAWLTGSIGWGTTWRNQPVWRYRLSETRVSNHPAYCPGHGGADFDVTSAVRQGADEHWPNVTIGLRSQNERDQNAWRRFDLNPTLEVKYNSRPDSPADLGMEGGLIPCVVGPDRPVVWTRTPRLRARLSDPDGGMLEAGFRVFHGPSDNYTWDGNETYTGQIPSGSFAEVTVPEGVVPGEGVYSWHLWAGDYQVSSWSEYCEFEVDNTRPGLPAVTSADYPGDLNRFYGGVGVAGSFTLSANGTPDVVKFRYSFDTTTPDMEVMADGLGGSATIQWTPMQPGPNRLTVQSVDRAGNLSDPVTYVFNVNYGPGAVAHWKFNGDLTDSTGKQGPLTPVGSPNLSTTGYEAGGIALDGVDDHLTRPQLIDTSKNFAVAAWVKVDPETGSMIIASQDGDRSSSFFLSYSGSLRKWYFWMPTSDTDWSYGGEIASLEEVQSSVWTHVAGVYDAAAAEIRLYVDGVLQGTAHQPAAWNGSGGFVVGRAKFNGQPVDFFRGAIDEVRVWDRVLTSDEIAALANQAVLRAHYPLNEGTGTTTRDTVTGREARLQGTASWEVGQYTSVKFVGVSGEHGGFVAAPRPDFRTDKSYTVMAWVRHDQLDQYARTAVSIGDPKYSPFLLQYRPEQRQWGMLIMSAPDCECGWQALSSTPAVAGQWVHLAAVYDGVKREVRLYVNGQLSGTASGGTVWNNDGELLIGRAQFYGTEADPWKGAVDEVRVFSGTLAADQIRRYTVRR